MEEHDIWFKVGLRSFIKDGKNLISDLKSINSKFKIFLDLKLYDIPNTMADAAEEICNLDIDMFNVHASSGGKAMSSVMDRVKNQKNQPLVLAVTALTSFDSSSFENIYGKSIETKAKELALEASSF